MKKQASKETSIYTKLVNSYLQTPRKLLVLDAILVFIVLTGVIQFLYMLIVGTFPYNSFLAGFGCSVGMFCNVANLRIQLNKDNETKYSEERIYGDFMFSSTILFVFAIFLIG